MNRSIRSTTIVVAALLASLILQYHLPLLGYSAAEAASVKKVHRGSVTFTSGANRMPVTLPEAVDPSKTIVWGGITHGGGRYTSASANDTRIAFDLESSMTLALERLGSPSSTPVIEWQAVEFYSGVLVQRAAISLAASGSGQGTATSPVDVILSRAIDPNKTFVLVSVAPNLGTNNNDERWTVRARLTSSTSVELTRNEEGTAVEVYLQVVELQGAAVQRGLTTISATTSATATINSIDPTRSFLIMSYRANSAVTGNEGRYATRGRVTNNTTLAFSRVSSNNSVDVAWEVVSMSDGTIVQANSRSTAATVTRLSLRRFLPWICKGDSFT